MKRHPRMPFSFGLYSIIEEMKKKLLLVFMCFYLIGVLGCKSQIVDYSQYSHSSSFDFHYQQLNEEEKSLYDYLQYQCENKIIEFPINRISNESFLRSLWALEADHPEYYWLYTHEDASVEKDIIGVKFLLLETIDIEETNKQLTEATQRILDEIPDGASTYEIVKHFYRTIVQETKYLEESEYNQDIRSVLLNHESVCAGYARAFQYLCHQKGIPCFYVSGTADNDGKIEGHSWNGVEIDGVWSWVDTTWGELFLLSEDGSEMIETDGEPIYHYLCFTDEELFKRHSFYEEDNFHDMSSYTIAFEYPSFTDKQYEYCVLNGCYFDAYDKYTIGNYIEQQYLAHPQDQIWMQFQDSEIMLLAEQELLGDNGYINDVLGKYYGQITMYTHYRVDDFNAISLTVK